MLAEDDIILFSFVRYGQGDQHMLKVFTTKQCIMHGEWITKNSSQ